MISKLYKHARYNAKVRENLPHRARLQVEDEVLGDNTYHIELGFFILMKDFTAPQPRRKLLLTVN